MKEHNEFNTKVEKDNYTITFNTSDKKRYEFVEKACRAMVDRNDTTVFIELPCAVGDTVYIIYKHYTSSRYVICKHTIVEIVITDKSIDFNTGLFTNHIENYNVTWFTDEAKADERLKELNNER